MQLQAFRVIAYEPQKDTPQVYFFTNRPPTAELRINMQRLNERKKRYEERIQTMRDYVTESKSCRGKFIAVYFGDAAAKDCGMCDNCLRNRSTELTQEEFASIHERIVSALPADTKSLLQQLNGIKKEKAWQVINFLQAENKLSIDENGMIRLT